MNMIGMTSQATRCRILFFGHTVRSSSVSSSIFPLIVSSTGTRMISCSEKHWGAGQYSSLIFQFSILFFNL